MLVGNPALSLNTLKVEATILDLCHAKLSHLGGGNLANDLSPMGRHDSTEGGGHGSHVRVPAVLGHGHEHVLSEGVHLEFVASAGQAVLLESLLDRGVGQELLEPAVLGQAVAKGRQVLLNGFQGLLLVGGRVEGRGISKEMIQKIRLVL